MRARTGKAARLTSVGFDKDVNDIPEDPAIAAAEKAAHEAAAKEHAEAEAAKAAEQAENDKKVEEAVAAHDAPKE